jgi:hypothetical protein
MYWKIYVKNCCWQWSSSWYAADYFIMPSLLYPSDQKHINANANVNIKQTAAVAVAVTLTGC